MPQEYLPRIADRELTARLSTAGAVLIEGPKACGKTETARRSANAEFRFDVDPGARALVTASPRTLFDNEPPVLLDEWQVAPELWDLVRREVDDRWPARGQFILTGSATPDTLVRRHSGAGRISSLRMGPMSLFESGHSTGEVSLQRLFEGEALAARDPGLSVPQILDRLVIGGWPPLIGANTSDAQQWMRDYITNIVEVDIQQLEGRRDPRNVRRLLTSLGRAVGTDTSVSSLAKDVGGANGPADWHTIDSYLDALERLMLVENVEAWATHMRSTTPLRKSATRYFVDPSVGVGTLAVGSAKLLSDLNATGFHFEGLAVRDVRNYAQPITGKLSHWRDNNGHEVDVIVSLDDGNWGAFEVKMNPGDIDQAAQVLARFVEKVDTDKVGKPAFLGVITTNTASYRRDDGVQVVNIANLGP